MHFHGIPISVLTSPISMAFPSRYSRPQFSCIPISLITSPISTAFLSQYSCFPSPWHSHLISHVSHLYGVSPLTLILECWSLIPLRPQNPRDGVNNAKGRKSTKIRLAEMAAGFRSCVFASQVPNFQCPCRWIERAAAAPPKNSLKTMNRLGWSRPFSRRKCLLRNSGNFGDGRSYAISVGFTPSLCRTRRIESEDVMRRRRVLNLCGNEGQRATLSSVCVRLWPMDPSLQPSNPRPTPWSLGQYFVAIDQMLQLLPKR